MGRELNAIRAYSSKRLLSQCTAKIFLENISHLNFNEIAKSLFTGKADHKQYMQDVELFILYAHRSGNSSFFPSWRKWSAGNKRHLVQAMQSLVHFAKKGSSSKNHFILSHCCLME